MGASRYLPDLEGWLHSLKMFAAAMLALYIAQAIGLDRPYWAMTTVYILAHPLSGAVRSKAVYRMFGTFIGAAVTIALVPNLVDSPELLTGALALWIGFCLYLSVLDRTPRGYAFMLAGYTAAIIGFPVVSAPDTVWDTAVSRVEEIWLGIFCTTVIASVVFPRPVGPVLGARLVAWRHGADRLALDALSPAGASDQEVGRARLGLAAGAVELGTLTTHLAYDTSRLHAATPLVAALEQRFVILLPVLAAIRDRLADLRAVDGVTPALTALLERLGAWFTTEPEQVPPGEAAALRTEITRIEGGADGHGWSDWPGMLREALLARLYEVIDLREDFLALRAAILAPGAPHRMPPLLVHMADRPRIHRDHFMAALRGIVVAVVLIVTCIFWIATGWPDGSLAALLAAVACCFTASQDDPVPALRGLMIAVLLASTFAAIGQFVTLPLASNFEMLTLAMAAFFIPAGLLVTIPALQKLAALAIFTSTLLALQENYAADFASWANGTAAAMVGAGLAVALSSILVPAGAVLSLRRRLRANWADLAAASRSRGHVARLELAELFLDRMGLLAPALAASAPDEQVAGVAAMTDLRVGINLVDLNAALHELPKTSPLAASVETTLDAAAAHYSERVVRDWAVEPPESMLHAIDRALDQVRVAQGNTARTIVRSLVGLRRSLFRGAAPYLPPAPAAPPIMEEAMQAGAA
jgi:uncharacterized membrane protein YccC